MMELEKQGNAFAKVPQELQGNSVGRTAFGDKQNYSTAVHTSILQPYVKDWRALFAKLKMQNTVGRAIRYGFSYFVKEDASEEVDIYLKIGRRQMHSYFLNDFFL